MSLSPLKQDNIAPEFSRGDVLISKNIQNLSLLKKAMQSISDNAYILSLPNISSIGAHVRHVIEFYQAFLNAATSDDAREICYDKRQRDMTLETSKLAAIEALNTVEDALSSLRIASQALTLLVIVNAGDPMEALETTTERELYHVLDHTVHHMALIKETARRQNITFDKNFGLANATQAHLNKSAE